MRHSFLVVVAVFVAQASYSVDAISAQEVKEITPAVAAYGLPATHSGITAAKKGFSKVEIFDGANLIEVFDNDSREVSEVHTDRAIIVWAAKDTQDVFQIWTLDAAQPLGGSNPRAITSTSYDNSLPRVWRTAAPNCNDPDPAYFVAWRGEITQNDADIFYFDSAAASPGITQITKIGNDAIKHEQYVNFPNTNLLDIEDFVIAWQGLDLDPSFGSATGDMDVYRYTLDPTITLTNISDPLDTPPPTTLKDHDWDPQTSGGYVVFHHDGHEPGGQARSEIRSFDPGAGSAHLLQADGNGTPDVPDSLYRPMVHGLNVTWVNGSPNASLAGTELWGSRADGLIAAPGVRMTNNSLRIDGYPSKTTSLPGIQRRMG